jgi:hypothetical protein
MKKSFRFFSSQVKNPKSRVQQTVYDSNSKVYQQNTRYTIAHPPLPYAVKLNPIEAGLNDDDTRPTFLNLTVSPYTLAVFIEY